MKISLENTKCDLENIRVVYYMNERSNPIMKLTLKKYFEVDSENPLKISVISNNFLNEELPYQDKIDYTSADIEYREDATHFGDTIMKGLNKITEDYILLMLDDQIVDRPIKYNDLQKLINFIKEEDVHYFGFSPIPQLGNPNFSWKPYDKDNYPFDKSTLFYRDNNFQYLLSLQPAIWKRNFLIDLCERCPFNLNPSTLDAWLPDILREYIIENNFKLMGHNLNSMANCIPQSSEYFILSYFEVLRRRCFWHPVNINYRPTFSFVENLIRDEKLLEKEEYKDMLFNINQSHILKKQ